ncbi:hypothetical protein EW026_g6025 [Hermanssonia centrifuga]|uniref:Uncharacterized protein n=1 Tax=Hermanssonia centrifuga TaxID=98765 RepID=A0A4V3X9W1_9APHY|nr:hypothetical protein EW026_g6025 [Hermanssonia centrifuga]
MNSAAAESAESSTAGPSKRAHLDHTVDENEDENMNQVPQEPPSLVSDEIVMPPSLHGPDIEDLYGSAAEELEAVSSVFPRPVPTILENPYPDNEPLDVGFDGDFWDHETNQTSPPNSDEASRAAADLSGLASLDDDDDDDEFRSMAGNRTQDDVDHTEPPPLHIDELRISQAFIDALRNASLDDENLHPDVLERLRHPPTEEYQLDDPALHLSLEIFLGLDRASEAHYHLFRSAVSRSHQIEMLSLHQVKRAVQDISGVRAVYDDMCINSCVAYTGPFF